MANELNSIKKTMSSLEIAELAGRNHKDVMRSIRDMEPAWVKEGGRNFALTSYVDQWNRQQPCYELDYRECMYIASKFEDGTRAKLVLRWDALETGKAVEEIKAGIICSINVLIEDCKEFGGVIPVELQGDYELSFKMDVKSLLQFYSGIFTKAGLERITGINQKQLWHYASGMRNPRPEQTLKIETALHKLGEELLAINL